MAFFKFRLPGKTEGDAQGNYSNAPAQSVDVLRRRARHRLIGASVLVSLAVIGFPVLFDTQPRPVSVDIAVDIPERANSKPQAVAPAPGKLAPLATGTGLDPKEEVVAALKDPKTPDKPSAAKAEVKPDPKVENKPEPKAEASPAKPVASDSKDNAPRFVVQVGSFSEEGKAREVRSKLEKAGFKTYTHVADTKEGKRTRVRVGPFASRDEADKAASKIKQLQMQPAVLSL